MEPAPQVVILMGVSGSGKSTVGRALADRLGWVFFDADDTHPPANIEKMSRGVALSDADRAPWLAAIRDLVAESLTQDMPAVVACSALKQSYRDQLLAGNDGAAIVYLKGDPDLISRRMQNRQGHFFKPGLLKSQFDDLEEPAADQAIVINTEQDVATVVDCIVRALEKLGKDNPF